MPRIGTYLGALFYGLTGFKKTIATVRSRQGSRDSSRAMAAHGWWGLEHRTDGLAEQNPRKVVFSHAGRPLRSCGSSPVTGLRRSRQWSHLTRGRWRSPVGEGKNGSPT